LLENTMKKLFFLGILLGSVMTVGCATVAAEPSLYVDIGPHHGNLRGAQENIVNAYDLVNQAQYDNNYRLGGHAARAKELLAEANEELRLAADSANAHGY
jgi:hypothetical protein